MTNERIVWTVLDGELRWTDTNGKPRRLLASEIYKAVFDSDAGVHNISPTDIEEQLCLTFSRYPVDLELHLSRTAAGIQARVRATSDMLTASVDIGNAAPTADHIVIDGTWYPINPACLDDLKRVISRIRLLDFDHVTLRQYLDLRRLKEAGAILRDTVPSSDEPTCVEPLQIGNTIRLYPYQADGLKWLSIVCEQELGGILGDEMGLGKTVQIIALLTVMKERTTPALVVAPTTILENWRREITKFAPRLSLLVHHGSDRTGFPSVLTQHDVVVTSYDLVVRDLALLRRVDWRLVALDEAQAIKNPRARRTVACKRLPRSVGVAITGTPVQNHLNDLWSLADFAVPEFLGPLANFEREYPSTEAGAEALRNVLRPILIRRRVADVAKDLPERVVCPHPIQFDEVEAQEYEDLRAGVAGAAPAARTVADLVKLRMFCTHPNLINTGSHRSNDKSTKYRRLLEILDEIVGAAEKAIVFTSFIGMIKAAAEDIPARLGIPVFSIWGGVPVPERQLLIDKFGAVAGSAVMLLNPHAAGVGLNITAANHVIHYTLEWNPAVEDQATARAYRRGQDLPVFVHRMFYINSVEEVINTRLERKRLLAETVVPGEDENRDYGDVLDALAATPIYRQQ